MIRNLRNLVAFCMAILLVLFFNMAAFAGNKGNNGNHNGHHNHQCDHRCNPRVVTVTNVVTVLRTNVTTVIRTNTLNVTVPVYVTNTVTLTVTNVVEAALDDASANYVLQAKHVYRLYVWHDGKWNSWGTVRSASNEVIRIIVPGYLTRAEPLVWQVVDVTAGFPRVAVPALEPVARPNRSFVAVNRMLQYVRR